MSTVSKDTLFFITPVHERFELTSISLRQKVDAIEQLEANGISADCVVIGDDDNIATARSLGLSVVIQNNDYLGRKFNDGHEFAAKHGATHVAPVGSDSWMDPKWLFDSLPHSNVVLASKHYVIVHKTGIKRAQLFIPMYVSYIVPVKLMAQCNYRPIYEKRPKGCDTNLMQTIGDPRRIYSENSHLLDTVAFQSPLQITDYDRIYGKWGVSQNYDPFGDLGSVFPQILVDEVQAFYDVDNELTSYDVIERALPYMRKPRSGASEELVMEMEACLIKRERYLALNNNNSSGPEAPQSV